MHPVVRLSIGGQSTEGDPFNSGLGALYRHARFAHGYEPPGSRDSRRHQRCVSVDESQGPPGGTFAKFHDLLFAALYNGATRRAKKSTPQLFSTTFYAHATSCLRHGARRPNERISTAHSRSEEMTRFCPPHFVFFFFLLTCRLFRGFNTDPAVRTLPFTLCY